MIRSLLGCSKKRSPDKVSIELVGTKGWEEICYRPGCYREE